MTFSGSNEDGPAALRREAADAFAILASGEAALGLAVSGGSDSTALLVLAADWARTRPISLHAATVDHGLRPEARNEAVAVGELCARLGVAHTILTWDRSAGAAGAVAQAEARLARHRLLSAWAHAQRIGAIALGHTRDDRIETFLMRARQGSGWHGLAGPLPSGPSPAWPEGRSLRLIRPLLAFGRDELRGDLNARGLGWSEDPSNEAERFERVRMRQLTRRMEEASLSQALRVMDGLAHMRAAVMAEARTGLARAELGPDAASIRREVFASLGPEARRRLLEALVMAAGGAALRPRREPLEILVARLVQDRGAAVAGATLAGAWLKAESDYISVSMAPPRRGGREKPGPCWDRTAALLADPRLEALAVRGGSTADPAS